VQVGRTGGLSREGCTFKWPTARGERWRDPISGGGKKKGQHPVGLDHWGERKLEKNQQILRKDPKSKLTFALEHKTFRSDVRNESGDVPGRKG